MAETLPANTPSLAESWSLPVDATVKEVETSHDENQKDASSEEPVAASAVSPVGAEKTDEISEEKTEEVTIDSIDEPPAEKTDESPADDAKEEIPSEESANENSVPENEPADPDEEQKSVAPTIKIETAPADFRFPTTNQTRHCFTRYIEYHRCIQAKGEGAPECEKFAKYYRSLCPTEWVERWNEQRENGTFPGPL